MTATLPTVNILAPIFNGGAHYMVCFQSLCALDYPPDRLTVHVVDDCSTDGTSEFLSNQKPPGFVKIHLLEKNRGRAGVRNYLRSLIDGDIIIMLDGDMEVQADFVRLHVAELQRPGRKAVVGRIMAAPWLPKNRLNRYLYESKLRGARQFGEGVSVGFQYLVTGNASMWRTAYDAGGAFDENFHHYGGEDTLFAYQFSRAMPGTIYYCDAALCYHHQHHRLRQYLGVLRDYAENNLPRILQQYPEIATPLAGDLAWPFEGDYFRRKRFRALLMFNPVTDLLAHALLPMTFYPVSNVVIRFLLVCTVVRCLRRQVKRRSIPLQPLPGKLPSPPAGQ